LLSVLRISVTPTGLLLDVPADVPADAPADAVVDGVLDELQPVRTSAQASPPDTSPPTLEWLDLISFLNEKVSFHCVGPAGVCRLDAPDRDPIPVPGVLCDPSCWLGL
jgi:hypothetical protein